MIEGVPLVADETRHRTLFVRKNDGYNDVEFIDEDDDDHSTCYVPINIDEDTTPVLSLIVPQQNNNNFSKSEYISSMSTPTSCHCYSDHFRESMPKDILPTTVPNSEKIRNKYSEEFPTGQQSMTTSTTNGGQKQKRRAKVRQEKSRFRTTPVTFEELREADEEVYLTQHKDDPQTTEFNFELRPKSWTFSAGTTNSRRSPSPTRRTSWHLQPLTNLHPLNWRPLSQESLLHLNSLSTLPTIPEERRLLNSPMTPSTDNFLIGALSSSTNDQQMDINNA